MLQFVGSGGGFFGLVQGHCSWGIVQGAWFRGWVQWVGSIGASTTDIVQGVGSMGWFSWLIQWVGSVGASTTEIFNYMNCLIGGHLSVTHIF